MAVAVVTDRHLAPEGASLQPQLRCGGRTCPGGQRRSHRSPRWPHCDGLGVLEPSSGTYRFHGRTFETGIKGILPTSPCRSSA